MTGAPLAAGTLPAGFTLIEVLVALVITAIALTAALRALGFGTDQTQALMQRQLAMLSAENQLAQLWLSKAWPNPGTQSQPCPQGTWELVCQQEVQRTENRNFRQVTITVTLPQRPSVPLARLTGVLGQNR